VGAAGIELRPLERADFPVLARWLAEPLVARWWNHEPTAEAVERDFGPAVDGAEPTELLLAQAGGTPFGFVQIYPIAAYAEYIDELGAVCEVPPGALSIDYLIGEPSARGRGLGARLIAAAVAHGFAGHPDARDVLVPVAVGNVASWRALRRAGATWYAEGELTPDNPVDPRDHVVHRFERPEPSQSGEFA
jgi:aminoglycoside 6'-N-acetyltransferase